MALEDVDKIIDNMQKNDYSKDQINENKYDYQISFGSIGRQPLPPN